MFAERPPSSQQRGDLLGREPIALHARAFEREAVGGVVDLHAAPRHRDGGLKIAGASEARDVHALDERLIAAVVEPSDVDDRTCDRYDRGREQRRQTKIAAGDNHRARVLVERLHDVGDALTRGCTVVT